MLDGSKGRNSLELKPWVAISPKVPPMLHVDNRWRPVALSSAKGAEGNANTGGSCSGFRVSAHRPKAATLLFKAGAIIHGYIAEEKLPQNALRPVIAK